MKSNCSNGRGSGTSELGRIVANLRDLRRFLKRGLLEGRSQGRLKELVCTSPLVQIALQTVWRARGTEGFDNEMICLCLKLGERLDAEVVVELLDRDDESLAILPSEAICHLVEWMDGKDVEWVACLGGTVLRRCLIAVEGLLLEAEDDRSSFDAIITLIASRLAVGVIPMPNCKEDRQLTGGSSHAGFVSGAVLEDPREDFVPTTETWEVTSVEVCGIATKMICSAVEALQLPPDVLVLIDRARRNSGLIEKQVEAVALSLGRATKEKVLPRWLPGEGLVEFRPCLAGHDARRTRIVSIAVEPRGRIPALSFIMGRAGIGPYGVDCWEMAADGQLVFPPEVKPGSPHRALRLLLTLMILREIEGRVTRPSQGAKAGDHSDTIRTGRHRGPVWPTFRRLPENHHVSDEAILRACQMVGYPPPDGMTFVASPPINALREGGSHRPQVIEVSDEGLFT